MREDLIEDYVQASANDIPSYLIELEKETFRKALKPKMISGRVQGRLLSFISKLKRPQSILELGTFTGYSALCLAEGLQEKGSLLSLEVNDELETFHEKFIGSSPYSSQINIKYGDAAESMEELGSESFDLIFIDANKKMYPTYLELCTRVLNPGGLLLADNVLWWDKVVNENAKDPETVALREFNRLIHESDLYSSFILPLRDGITIAQKK
jgi:caffeoyl-CoA O-methyltransferase